MLGLYSYLLVDSINKESASEVVGKYCRGKTANTGYRVTNRGSMAKVLSSIYFY